MSLLNRLLGRMIKEGSLTIIDARGREHSVSVSGEPAATVRLHDPALHRKLYLRPELYAGEAYVDGSLTIEEGSLRDLLTLYWVNGNRLSLSAFHRLIHYGRYLLRHVAQYNPLWRAQKNVAHHYDLSRELYALFLDPDLQYSCGYYSDQGDTLEQAQINKKRHIAAKLLLQPGQRVLDIGCGWGGLALYLATVADVDVVGITLSSEQLAVARQRAEDMGLADRVHFIQEDYRKVTGPFDRIVSVGMFEHVGVPHYRAFFSKIQDLLAPDGIALIHSIGLAGPPDVTNPWLKKYIFPGGYTPALSEVLPAVERTGLWTLDCEILRLHYAYTLAEWYRRFQANRQRIAALFDERFCRLWEFYLLNCEMAFSLGDQMVFQLQLGRRRDAAPLTRDYIPVAKHVLVTAESAEPMRPAALVSSEGQRRAS